MPFPIAVLLLLPAAQAGGKDPCADAYVTEDKFTKETTSRRARNFPALSAAAPIGYEVTTQAGSAKLALVFAKTQAHDASLPAGYTAKFLMADGSVLDISAPEETRPVAGVHSTTSTVSVFTTWVATFPLDKATLDSLTAQEIAAIRAPNPGGDITWENGAGLKALRVALSCAATLAK